jgi:hypothetical protein
LGRLVNSPTTRDGKGRANGKRTKQASFQRFHAAASGQPWRFARVANGAGALWGGDAFGAVWLDAINWIASLTAGGSMR